MMLEIFVCLLAGSALHLSLAGRYGYGYSNAGSYYPEGYSMPNATPAGRGMFDGKGGGSSEGGDIFSAFGLSTTSEKPKQPAGNFDKHLDSILTNLAKTIRTGGFDPLKIDRVLQCRNCTFQGLSLIRRGGPSTLNYANRSLVIDAYIHLPALYISCFPCTETLAFGLKFTGMTEISLWDVIFYGKVVQKFERGASPDLVEYKVVSEGELDIDFHAFGILAPVVRLGFKLILQRGVSNFVRDFIYERVPNFIVQQLKGFSLPFGK